MWAHYNVPAQPDRNDTGWCMRIYMEFLVPVTAAHVRAMFRTADAVVIPLDPLNGNVSRSERVALFSYRPHRAGGIYHWGPLEQGLFWYRRARAFVTQYTIFEYTAHGDLKPPYMDIPTMYSGLSEDSAYVYRYHPERVWGNPAVPVSK